MSRDVTRVIEASAGLARKGEKEAIMLVVRLTAILALVYSLSLNPASDAGLGLDPNGISATSSGDHRCTIDPNGNCTSAFGDRGAGLDPNG